MCPLRSERCGSRISWPWAKRLDACLRTSSEEILLLTTSDLNHYENDATTRIKDRKAIDRILALDARGLYDTCRNEAISMCGLGPTVAMLTALKALGARQQNWCAMRRLEMFPEISARSWDTPG